MTEADLPVDFDAAEFYLRMAHEAHETGNDMRCKAALKMVAIALGFDEGPAVRFHIDHLNGK